MPPVDVPRYQKFPLGDGVNNDVMSCIAREEALFNEKTRSSPKKKVERQPSAMSTSSVTSCDMFSFPVSENVCKGWQWIACDLIGRRVRVEVPLRGHSSFHNSMEARGIFFSFLNGTVCQIKIEIEKGRCTADTESKDQRFERQGEARCQLQIIKNEYLVSLGLRNWWGTERLDYALYNPKSLHQLPLSVLCPLFHSSFWESKDVVAFMIRQVTRRLIGTLRANRDLNG